MTVDQQNNKGFEAFLAAFAVIAIGFTIYSNVLHGEFISDDYITVVQNSAIRNLFNFNEIWKAFNTRFLVGLSFALNWRIGQLDVLGYHLFNIVIHLLTSFVVYKFVLITFETPAMSRDPFRQDANTVAFFSCLMFLCHPIQTQAVAFITQRAVVMASLFYLLTLLFYVKARLIKSKPPLTRPAMVSHKVYYGCAIVSMICGIFSKEMMITLPVMLLVYEFFFFDFSCRDILVKVRRVMPFFLLAAMLPFILMQDQAGSVLDLKGQISIRHFNWDYLFTEINVLRTYIRLLFFPVNQNHDYDYPISHGFLEGKTLLSFLFLTIILISAVMLWKKKKRMISFSIIWFFITTSVEAIVVSFVNRGVIYEHWVYLAMVGFSFFLSSSLMALLKDKTRLKWITVISVLVMSIMTYQRNKVWQNEIIFWEDVIKKSHNKSTVYFGAGTAYQRKEYYDKAILYYRKAIRLYAEKGGDERHELDRFYLSRIYNNLGTIFSAQERDIYAIDSYTKSSELNPYNARTYNNLAISYYNLGRDHDAIKSFKKSMELQGDYPYAYLYSGLSYLALGQEGMAKESLEKALHLFENEKDREHVKQVKDLLKSF